MSELLPRVRKARKLMALVPGCGTSGGNRTSSPDPVLFVTVTFADIETAPSGIPQTPNTGKFRVALGRSAGPPSWPDPTRVSMARQGVRPWNVVGTTVREAHDPAFGATPSRLAS